MAAALLTWATACDSTTEPPLDFDGSRFPYVVSNQGVRHFGTSRVLVIPARFQDGAPLPLTAAEMHSQLFGGSSGGPVNQAFALASEGVFTLKGKVTSWVQTTVPAAMSGTGIYGQLYPMPAESFAGITHIIASIAAVVLGCFHGGYGLRRKQLR